MAGFEWVAKNRGELRSASLAGGIYSADFELDTATPVHTARVEESIALAGVTETEFHRIDNIWSIKTLGLNDLVDGEFQALKEMITSVMGGESLIFDPYGSIASPDRPRLAILVPGSYSPKRTGHVYGTAAPTWEASFRLRLLP